MAAPAVGVGARIAVPLLDDLLIWGLLALAIAVFVLLLPILLPVVGFGAILALFSGLRGVPQGGGPVPGGSPTTVAVGQIPSDQLALMQQVASSAPCQLPWTALAAIADVESGFGKSADQVSSAPADETWRRRNLPSVRLGERKILFSRRGLETLDQAAIDRAWALRDL